jgi:ribosome-interacting GTPase 1
MARTQKNKATSGHLGMLKAKLAKLRRDLLDPSKAPGGGGGGGGGDGFDVNKVGDARVGFVGFPSVGKSTLLTKLTGTHSEAAAYEFTTLTAVPGIVRYRGAKIQMLDLPGIIEGAKDGKGRGRQVISTARTCNLILIVLDCLKPLTHKKLIEHGESVKGCGVWSPVGVGGEGGVLQRNLLPLCSGARALSLAGGRAPKTRSPPSRPPTASSPSHPAQPSPQNTHTKYNNHPTELESFGIRLNKKPPNITFKKKERGGINFTVNPAVREPRVDAEAVKAVLSEYRAMNADVYFGDDYEIDDLVDVVEGGRVYIPALYVVNKIDQISLEELEVMDRLVSVVCLCC